MMNLLFIAILLVLVLVLVLKAGSSDSSDSSDSSLSYLFEEKLPTEIVVGRIIYGLKVCGKRPEFVNELEKQFIKLNGKKPVEEFHSKSFLFASIVINAIEAGEASEAEMIDTIIK